jgi:hypothetical protein
MLSHPSLLAVARNFHPGKLVQEVDLITFVGILDSTNSIETWAVAALTYKQKGVSVPEHALRVLYQVAIRLHALEDSMDIGFGTEKDRAVFLG